MNNLKLYKNKVYLPALLLLFLVATPFYSAKAQMFSVRSAEQNYSLPNVGVYLGVEPAQFRYKPKGSGINTYTRYDFKGPIYRVQLELPNINIHFGTGWNLGPQNLMNYLTLGANIGGSIRFFHSRVISILLPLRLTTDYTQIQTKKALSPNSEFQESIGTIGGGPMIDLRLARRVRFSTNVLLNYGFSVRSMGTTAGSVYNLISRSRIYFDDLFNDMGLSLGFDYNFRDYNASGVRYDYALRGYSILLGVTF